MRFYELFTVAPSFVAIILLLVPLPYWLLLYPLEGKIEIAERYVKTHSYPAYIMIGIPIAIDVVLGILGSEVSISDDSFSILLLASVIVSFVSFIVDSKKNNTNIKVTPYKKAYVNSLLYYFAMLCLVCWEFIDPIIK